MYDMKVCSFNDFSDQYSYYFLNNNHLQDSKK